MASVLIALLAVLAIPAIAVVLTPRTWSSPCLG